MEYELVSGTKFEPFFKSDKEYEAFRRSFYESVKPALDEQARKRAESELVSMTYIVD